MLQTPSITLDEEMDVSPLDFEPNEQSNIKFTLEVNV